MSLADRIIFFIFLVVTAVLAGASLALAQVPYEQQYSTGQFITRSASIVVPAQLHPEVAVSRTLAAQPVHPHLVKIILGGIQPDNNGATMHTWIDPLHRIDGEDGLDESHSLVKAQRLFLSLGNYNTRNINDLRAHSRNIESSFASQSKARLIISPKAGLIEMAQVSPVLIIPAPGPAKITQPQKLMAQSTD